MAHLPRRITLDHLWIITILWFIWIFVSITPMPPNDLWWHMAAGRIMLQEQAWMYTNRWAYTVEHNAVFALQSWLSEIVLYGLWNIGGIPFLALARIVAITGSYALMAWHAWRRVQQGKAVALALVLAILIGWNNWTLRPQTLAMIPAALFIVILGEYLENRISRRWLFTLPLIMLIWVNAHGSFMLGLILLSLAWVSTIISARSPNPEIHTPARQKIGPLMIVGIVIFLTTLAQPQGTGIFGYVHMTISHPLHNRWFIEWLPPDNRFGFGNTGFWFFFMLLILAMFMAIGTRRPSLTDVLWYCALAWITIGGVRYAMWFALLLLPLAAQQCAILFEERIAPALHVPFALGYGMFVGATIIATLPWFEPGRYLGPESMKLFASSGEYNMLLSSTTPVGATEWLANNNIEGHFWTDMSYSSYTIWQLPQKQVFVDLRVELFPEKIWEDYFAISRGNEYSLTLLDTWHISHLMIDTQWQKSLYNVLTDNEVWCKPYEDLRAAIFVRCALIEKEKEVYNIQ